MANSEITQANTDLNLSNSKDIIKAIIEPYLLDNYRKAVCYLALIFHHGERTMLQMNVPTGDLPFLLKAKPADTNEIESARNRPLMREHIAEIKQYIISRSKANKSWILGTVTANVDPDNVEIIEFYSGFCLVVIPKGVSLNIIDGVHRTYALIEILTSDERDLINETYIPITLVLGKSRQQSQTDFLDMAKIKPIPMSLLISFGDFSGVVGITKKLIEKVSMFHEKTEKIKSFPSSRSKLIYTPNYIARAVSCAFTNDSSEELLDYDVEKSYEALAKCFNQFFSECNQTRYIFEANAENLTVEEVSKFKEECLLGISAGLEILGRLLYYTYEPKANSFNAKKISQLARLDWSKQSELWQGNVVIVDPKFKDSGKPYKITGSTIAIATAVQAVKEVLGWT